MKITKRQLRGIIREELLQEQWPLAQGLLNIGSEWLKKKAIKGGATAIGKSAAEIAKGSGEDAAKKLAQRAIKPAGKVAKGIKTADKFVDAATTSDDERAIDRTLLGALDTLGWWKPVAPLAQAAKLTAPDIWRQAAAAGTTDAEGRTGTYPEKERLGLTTATLPDKFVRRAGVAPEELPPHLKVLHTPAKITTKKKWKEEMAPPESLKQVAKAAHNVGDIYDVGGSRRRDRETAGITDPPSITHSILGMFGKFESGIKENKVRITKHQLHMLVREAMGMSHGGGDPHLATMDYKEWAEDYMGTRSGANSSSVLATYVVDEELSEDEWLPIALEMGMSPRDVGLEVVRQQREYDAGGTLSDEEDFERGFRQFGLYEIEPNPSP